jgi:hypothetical protein
MTTLELNLPESLLQSLREIAEREHVSLDQLAASALSEKVAALMGTTYLETRAKRANLAAYHEILTRVPDVPPVPPDTKVPEDSRNSREKLLRAMSKVPSVPPIPPDQPPPR